MNSTKTRHAAIKMHAISKSVPHLNTAMQMSLSKTIQTPHFETKLQATPQFTAKSQAMPKFKARLQAKAMPKFKASPKIKATLQLNSAQTPINSPTGHHLA